VAQPVTSSVDRRWMVLGQAFGVFGSVAAGGGAVGLILGGVLTQYLSWRWTLYVNLVFAAIAVAGALVYIRSSRPAERPRMDWPGTVLASAGLFLIGAAPTSRSASPEPRSSASSCSSPTICRSSRATAR
jgi:MFS family permease